MRSIRSTPIEIGLVIGLPSQVEVRPSAGFASASVSCSVTLAVAPSGVSITKRVPPSRTGFIFSIPLESTQFFKGTPRCR